MYEYWQKKLGGSLVKIFFLMYYDSVNMHLDIDMDVLGSLADA